MNIADGQKYVNYLSSHDDQMEALENLYRNVNDIHSHLISGPDNSSFDRVLEELEKIEEIIGVNLTNKE